MPATDLPALFAKVAGDLDEQRESLNQADEANQDHGNHMLEIFQIAVQAAEEKRDAPMAEAMGRAAELLRLRTENGSAQVYARGLAILARHFEQRSVDLDDLVHYVSNYLNEQKESAESQPGGGEATQMDSSAKSGDILKALLAALSEWEQVETSQIENTPYQNGGSKSGSGLNIGYLFGVGMAYMQAKQKGGEKLDILSETVVSASPLSKVPYRHLSGVIAVRSLLEGMKD